MKDMVEKQLRSCGRGRGRREEGIALFIVVMAMSILYLLVFQIHYVSKMEEGISRNRTGNLDISYALQAVARWAVAQIQDDLTKDVEEAGGTEVNLGGGQIGGAAGGIPALNDAGGLAGGASLPGGGGGTIDSLGEPLFYPADKTLNDVKVRVKVTDGEGKLSLNRLFEYAAILKAVDLSEKEESKVGGAAEAAQGEDAALAEGEEQAINDLLRRVWEPPNQDEVDATGEMLERLIQGVVEWNQQMGYMYLGSYNPAIISEEIMSYVLERKSRPGDSYIFEVTELLNLPDVTTELFYGPSKELNFQGTGLIQQGLLLDEFNDVTFDPNAWGLETQDTLQAILAEEFLSQGYEGYDMSQMMGLYSQQVGYLTQYPENEEGTGILRPPEPAGLRSVFTAFSSGKINLNTAHPAVLFGLLRDLTLDEDWQVVQAIEEFRDAYKQEEDEEGSAAMGADLLNARTAEDVESALQGQGLAEEAFAGGGGLELNVFTGNWKMEIQELGDGEFLKPSGARAIDASSETDLYQRVVNCLEPVASSRSEYFLVEIKGKKDNVMRAGELVVRRDYKGKRIRVLQWRDRVR
ncbi:MAG: hypothetical protein JXP34_07020 [Planctomycetes bacterium]|nr:hypothetical protein [Planctomycetota bacterium]